MKAYITCPITHSQKRHSLLSQIKFVVESKNIDSYVFEVGGEPKDIFEEDYNQLKSCDILIAEVSEPSHGVGIEIGIAFSLNHRIILLLEKGNRVTKLAQGMPNAAIIEYENIEDLKQRLSLELEK